MNENIDNENEEDIIIESEKISIKHSSNKKATQNSIKILWTENKELQEKYINTMQFKCDLLIVYVRFENIENGELEILYIAKEKLNEEKRKKKDIFKRRENSNGRGIEFTKIFFDKIKEKSEFQCKIKFKHMYSEEESSPIQRRMKLCDQWILNEFDENNIYVI